MNSALGAWLALGHAFWYGLRKARGGHMQVAIKDLSVEMEIKNNGVELDVYSRMARRITAI